MTNIFGYPVVEGSTGIDLSGVIFGNMLWPDPLTELFSRAKVGDKVTLMMAGKRRDFTVTSLDPIRLQPAGEWQDA